jgi:hypothetical protein
LLPASNDWLSGLLSVPAAKFLGSFVQFLVERPERDSSQESSGKKVNIDVAQPFPHDIVGFDKGKYFSMFDQKSHRQSCQKRNDTRSVSEVSTRKLAYDERMTNSLSVVEQFYQTVSGLSEMVYPD